MLVILIGIAISTFLKFWNISQVVVLKHPWWLIRLIAGGVGGTSLVALGVGWGAGGVNLTGQEKSGVGLVPRKKWGIVNDLGSNFGTFDCLLWCALGWAL